MGLLSVTRLRMLGSCSVLYINTACHVWSPVVLVLLVCLIFSSSYCIYIMAQNRENRRYPQNLQGVLQLAVEAGSAADGPAPPEPMSEEVHACSCTFQIWEGLGQTLQIPNRPWFQTFQFTSVPQEDLRAVWHVDTCFYYVVTQHALCPLSSFLVLSSKFGFGVCILRLCF